MLNSKEQRYQLTRKRLVRRHYPFHQIVRLPNPIGINQTTTSLTHQ